jgi:R3H domain
MRKKDRDIPPELHDQWERDRAKKADRKRLRTLTRLQSAENASPTRRSSRRNENVLGGARVQGNTVYADRVNTLSVLEELIRKFLGNLDMMQLVLPPKGKDWRKRAHLLAEAFNLKSKSTGKGEGRFMTLIKTTRSGISINERKIFRLVGGDNGEGFKASHGGAKPVRHRDGDEVGKMAPRLSGSNVGFKLLQQMG